MTIPRADALTPIPGDLDVLERVQALLGRGHRRQLWLMFVDDRHRQLPLLMPSDIPPLPREHDEHSLADFIDSLVAMVDAHAVIVTLERRGDDAITDVDRRWLRLVREACRLAEVPLRGPLLAHGRGVRWIAAEDLE